MDEELDKLRGDKKIPVRVLIKRTLGYTKGKNVRLLVLAFIISLFCVLFNVALPLIMEYFIDYLDDGNIVNVTILGICGIVGGYLLLTFINLMFSYLSAMLLQKVGQQIVYDLRMDVFSHIENLSQNQFNEMPAGSLVTRVANYTSSISDLFTDVLVSFVKDIALVIVVFIVMCYKSWRLSLILLAFGVLIAILSFVFGKFLGNVYRNERKSISSINTFLSENLSGMRIIQIFNNEKKKEKEFSIKNENLRKHSYHINLIFTAYRPLMTFLQTICVVTVLLFGFYFKFNAAEIVAFYLLIGNFFNPIGNMADQIQTIQSALTGGERLFNLLDVQAEVVDKKDAIDVTNFKGKIEFKHVWFAYKKDEWILKDVSFVINPKESVAFVGATGAGKTTILSLIVRNYEIQKGEILIDDINVNDIKIDSLRKGIGQMLQDVFLFSGTIKSNITLHDEDFKDEEIEDASKYVNADTFIDKLKNRYDEEVIERGENFSQGQRQLLSFARTILHKPQILILDEATANIDTETELVIQKSLENMKNIGTMLVVAHRLSTIQHSDKIIVLQNGKIIEQGNHQELLKNRGYYYKLYLLQYKNN